MRQIGNVPEINAVKLQLEKMKELGLLKDWELPYEELLTRLTAAIFFVSPSAGTDPTELWDKLQSVEKVRYRLNNEKKMSQLEWRVEFNQDSLV